MKKFNFKETKLVNISIWHQPNDIHWIGKVGASGECVVVEKHSGDFVCDVFSKKNARVIVFAPVLYKMLGIASDRIAKILVDESAENWKNLRDALIESEKIIREINKQNDSNEIAPEAAYEKV